MSELLERVKLNNLVYGDGIAENYKNNSLYFYNKFSKSDAEVTSMNVGQMQLGGFYHLHYMDDSNWMRYSPIFTVDFKKFENLIVIIGINFNFIPLEVRVSIFDKFIKEEDFEKNTLLEVDFQGVYKELLQYGFEYALVEYNLQQVQLVHKINMEAVPRFLYSGHPKNKYDPKKLYEIWSAKLDNRADRDAEMSKALIKDFYQISDDIKENYKLLKGHADRIRRSLEKYGR
jgi:hypothetical protein